MTEPYTSGPAERELWRNELRMKKSKPTIGLIEYLMGQLDILEAELREARATLETQRRALAKQRGKP